MLPFSHYLRLILSVHILAAFFSSCKDTGEIDIEEPIYVEDYPTWTHLDGIYKDHDSTILSSYRSSDSIIMFSTAQGVSYFNTRTKSIDKQLGLYSGFAWPYSSIINEYATVYIKDSRIIVHDNNKLPHTFLRIPTQAYFDKTIAAFQDDRLYYQYDIEVGNDSTAIWKIRYLDLVEFANGYPPAIDLEKNEVQIPLTSFVAAHGLINNFWVYDDMLFASLNNNFYRISRDGTFNRLSWEGQDIYPGNMFQIGERLFVVCNRSSVFDHPLLFSNDLGDTWQPYTNNDDYGSFNYMRQGHALDLDNQHYLAGSFGLLSRLNFVDAKFSVDPLSFDGSRPAFFQSLYSSEDRKFVYSITSSGIWVINKSLFTSQ